MNTSVVRQTLRLALPVVATQLGYIAMGIVDTVMVGRVGAQALSAVALGNSVSFTLLVLCMGTIMSLDPIVSQAYGAGRYRECGTAVRHGYLLALLLTLPVTAILAFCRPLLVVLRQRPEMVEGAASYIHAINWGVFPFLSFAVLRQFMQGVSHPRPAMLVVLVANVLNVFFNWVLIYGHLGAPPLGATGAAWATALCRWSMFLGLAAWVFSQSSLHKFGTFGLPRPFDRSLFARLLHLGLPIGGQFALEVGVFAMVTVLMGWFGPLEVAGHQIALNLCSTTFMVPLGFSATAAVLVGQALGRNDVAGARQAAFTVYALGLGFMALAGLCFGLFPGAFVRIYTSDPELAGMGVSLLLVGAAFQISDGTQTISIGALRGAADTRVPMWVAAVSYWFIGLPLGYLLAFQLGWGPRGLWWGLTCGLTLVGLVLALRFHRCVRAERLVAMQVG